MSVHLTEQDGLAIITLDRPEALNALSFAILARLGEAIDAVAASKARALIFIGAGTKAFCAGADIPELVGRDLATQKRGLEFGQSVLAKIERLPMASVATINGYAFGGGLELALACTFRLATPNAKMGLPEMKLGLIPGYGGTQRLPRLIGQARALEMILMARTIDAAEAERIGLVNRLVEGDPLQEAIAFTRGFTGYSLPVLGFAREAVQRSADVPLADGLAIEAALATLAYRTHDAEEGMAAFVEKRKPKFRDA